MKYVIYLLNELIKSYHVYARFDAAKARELLEKINGYRLEIALAAEQREIFYSQLTAEANVTGYKNDLTFTRDDQASVVSRIVAFLEADVTISLTQLGRREQLLTRQQVQWQQLFSDVQDGAVRGEQIPFDFPQEILLDRDESLAIGVTNQSAINGQLILHGANLKDAESPDVVRIKKEILTLDENGRPRLPQTQLVPIQFRFTAAVSGNRAVAVDGGDQIFSLKSRRSVILTDVSTDSINSRISLTDTGRNQEICTEVESLGIAGFVTNQFTTYYPLPYPHLLRGGDRLRLMGLNGSAITAAQDAADTTFTVCFRGFTI